MLSFEPMHHRQITKGDFAGSWVPLFPSIYEKTDLNFSARIHEAVRIRNQGGTIVNIDPMGDSATLRRIYAMYANPGRSTDTVDLQNEGQKKPA